MEAIRLPREVVEAASRDAYLERYPTGREAAAPTNVGPTLQLIGDGDALGVPYRGINYALGFVSFADGVRLIRAKAQIEELADAEVTDETLAVYLEGMRVVVRMAPRYLRPVSRWRRLLAPFRRNPFRSATDREIGQVLGFFLASRMRSRVLLAPGPARAPDPTS